MPEYIEREALLQDIQDTIDNSGCVNHEIEIIDCVRYAMPPADVVRVVTARYIDTGNNCLYGHSRAVKCSNCGAIVGLVRSFKYKYCHACGAKMNGGKPNAR